MKQYHVIAFLIWLLVLLAGPLSIGFFIFHNAHSANAIDRSLAIKEFCAYSTIWALGCLFVVKLINIISLWRDK
jgi:hypothetical protein